MNMTGERDEIKGLSSPELLESARMHGYNVLQQKTGNNFVEAIEEMSSETIGPATLWL